MINLQKKRKKRKEIRKKLSNFKNYFVFSILDLLSFHLYDMRKPDIYKYIVYINVNIYSSIYIYINIVYIEYYNEELEIMTH